LRCCAPDSSRSVRLWFAEGEPVVVEEGYLLDASSEPVVDAADDLVLG
jgi:hypothetical protein